MPRADDGRDDIHRHCHRR